MCSATLAGITIKHPPGWGVGGEWVESRWGVGGEWVGSGEWGVGSGEHVRKTGENAVGALKCLRMREVDAGLAW